MSEAATEAATGASCAPPPSKAYAEVRAHHARDPRKRRRQDRYGIRIVGQFSPPAVGVAGRTLAKPIVVEVYEV